LDHNENKMEVSIMNPLQTAAVAHFEAKRTRALANLQVYLTSPVGVGEHSDIVGEVVAMVQKIADAEGCLEVLSRVVESPTNEETE
jgi:hypothetical protein